MGFDSQLSFPEINYVKRLCYRGSMKKKMEKIIPEHDAEKDQNVLRVHKVWPGSPHLAKSNR